MVIWDIINIALKKRGKKEKDPRKAHLEALKEINKNLYLQALQALPTIQEAYQQEQNPKIKYLLRLIIGRMESEREVADQPERMITGNLIAAIALAEAIKHNLHKDPQKLAKYLTKTALEFSHQTLQALPYIEEESDFLPHNILLSIVTLFGNANLDDEFELIRKVKEKVREDKNLWRENPQLAKVTLDTWAKADPQLSGWWHLTSRDILEGPEEGEKLAPKLAAKVLEERLPGAAYRLAVLLHAAEQGAPITPEELADIIEATTSPHSPQGTQHYNLLYRMIDRLEQAIASNQQPPGPAKLLEQILREAMELRPYHDPEQVLQQAAQGRKKAEATLLKLRLGLPGDKAQIARATLNLLRLTRQIEQGKPDPNLADTRSEMAALARHIKETPRKPTPQYLERINPQTLEYIFNQINREYTEKATQLGRETALKTLNKALQHAKKAMQKHAGKPYPQLVAEVTREVTQALRGELGGKPTLEDIIEARWAALTIQHLLHTLPIHVAETREELGMAKHLLTQGYNPEEYNTPLLLGTMWYIKRMADQEPEARKEAILQLRDILQVAESTKTAAWRTLTAHREEGPIEARRLARDMVETIRTVSRVKK